MMRNLFRFLVWLLPASRGKNALLRLLGHEVSPDATARACAVWRVERLRMGPGSRMRMVTGSPEVVPTRGGSSFPRPASRWSKLSEPMRPGTTATKRNGEAMSKMTVAMTDLRTRQKSSKGVSYYSRLINRPLGRVLAAGFSLTPLTPNQVSLISAAITAAGVALLATAAPTVGVGVAVWALLALGFAVDSADGQLARLRGGGSAAGEWLDHVLDAAKMVAVHTAVLISWYRFTDLPDAALLIPLAYQLIAVTMFAGGVLAELLQRHRAEGHAPATPSRLRAVALLGADYGVFCAMFLLLGWSALFAAVYTAAAAVNALALAALAARWFLTLRRL